MITVSLLCIVAFFVLVTGIIAVTIVRTRRRAAGPVAGLVDLARECDISDLEDIDDALLRILEEEPGKVPSWSTFQP